MCANARPRRHWGRHMVGMTIAVEPCLQRVCLNFKNVFTERREVDVNEPVVDSYALFNVVSAFWRLALHFVNTKTAQIQRDISRFPQPPSERTVGETRSIHALKNCSFCLRLVETRRAPRDDGMVDEKERSA